MDADGHQEGKCGKGEASACDLPRGRIGTPVDRCTAESKSEPCSGHCPSAVTIAEDAEAASKLAQPGITVYGGNVSGSLTSDGLSTNIQPVPNVGATLDVTIPKPDDSKGNTVSVGTGGKVGGV